MTTCNGHQITIQVAGLEIDGQFYRWEEMCLAYPRNPRGSVFPDPKGDLTQTLSHVLRYPNGEVNLDGCREVLDAVQRRVKNCN